LKPRSRSLIIFGGLELPSSNFSWKAPWIKAVDVLVSCGQKCWVPLVGITGYVSYAPALVTRQVGGIQHIPRTVGLAEFFGFSKDQPAQEVLETIKKYMVMGPLDFNSKRG